MRYGWLLAVALFPPLIAAGDGDPPTQIHLSYDIKGASVVSWRANEPGEGHVEFGTTPALGSSVPAARNGHWHSAAIEGLIPDRTYHYRCGRSTGGWSPTFSFKTAPAGAGRVVLAAYGDQGVGPEARAVSALVAAHDPHAVLLCGDLSYANGTDQAIWDEWFDVIQGAATRAPHMPVLGNHETIGGDEAVFFDRFTLPGNERWYSFRVGRAHVIGIDSMTDFSPGSQQYQWIAADLERAAQDPSVSWKIAFAHYSPFTSSDDHPQDGLAMRAHLSPLFDTHGVDLVLTAHEHHYERTLPILGGGAVDPRAPVYVVSGTGGRPLAGFVDPPPSWSVARRARHGFTKVTIDDTLSVEFVALSGAVEDAFEIVQSPVDAPLPRTLVARSTAWRFCDDGADLGTSWRQLSYDDAAWRGGPAPLGYGEPYLATLVRKGPVTTYFRRVVALRDAAPVRTLTLGAMFDDGFVAYLNGSEVARVRMPGGTIRSSTLAFWHEAEERYEPLDLDHARAFLRDGENVLAVEVHQTDRSSSDLVFDAELIAEFSGTPPLVPILLSPADNATTGVTPTFDWSDVAGATYRLQVGAVLDIAGLSVSAFTTSTPLQPGTYAWRVQAAGTWTAPRVITVAGDILIPRGSAWSFHDRGLDLGTDWRAISTDDAAWPAGRAPLGYGEPFIATVLSYGPDPSRKHTTTYLRRRFTASPGATLRLNVLYDDGFVAYLNGVEILRARMPDAPVGYATEALWHEAEEVETFDLAPFASLLRDGENVLAVEVHQTEPTSSDLVFDAELGR
ncbi:MAG: purple acid phosphatase [Planctomycetes bacterium]|nr:purple acid phosphatase [Planctomycetota bacterium]